MANTQRGWLAYPKDVRHLAVFTTATKWLSSPQRRQPVGAWLSSSHREGVKDRNPDNWVCTVRKVRHSTPTPTLDLTSTLHSRHWQMNYNTTTCNPTILVLSQSYGGRGMGGGFRTMRVISMMTSVRYGTNGLLKVVCVPIQRIPYT